MGNSNMAHSNSEVATPLKLSGKTTEKNSIEEGKAIFKHLLRPISPPRKVISTHLPRNPLLDKSDRRSKGYTPEVSNKSLISGSQSSEVMDDFFGIAGLEREHFFDTRRTARVELIDLEIVRLEEVVRETSAIISSYSTPSFTGSQQVYRIDQQGRFEPLSDPVSFYPHRFAQLLPNSDDNGAVMADYSSLLSKRTVFSFKSLKSKKRRNHFIVNSDESINDLSSPDFSITSEDDYRAGLSLGLPECIETLLRPVKRNGKGKALSWGRVWRTPGDGLCVLHSLYCHLPRFNYLALVSKLFQEQKLDGLREYFIKPELEKWSKDASWQIMDEIDRANLLEYLRGGSRPKNLDVGLTSLAFSTFYGLKDIPVYHFENLNGIQQDLLKGHKFGDGVYLRDGHASFLTAEEKLFKETENYCKQGFANIIPAEERSRLDSLMSLFVTEDEKNKKILGVTAKLTETRTNLLQSKLECEKTKSLLLERPDLSAKIVEPSFAKQTGLLFEHGQFVGYYSHRFKLGPQFSKVVEDLGCRIFATPQKYAHPGLRILADRANFEMIKAGLNRCAGVFEHAAKYAKTTKWLKSRCNYEFSRPNIILGTDDIYRQTNRSNALYLDYDAYRVSELGCFANFFHVFTDVIYYPDVWRGIMNLAVGTKGAFSCGCYPLKEGRYFYFDDEGYFEVRGGEIFNCPKLNGKGYKHPANAIGNSSFSVKTGNRFCNASLNLSAPTGLHSTYNVFDFVISDFALYPILDLWIGTTPISIEYNNIDTKMSQSIKCGKIEWDSVNQLKLVKKNLFVDNRAYEFLQTKAFFKTENWTSNTDQKEYLFRVYRAEYGNCPFYAVLNSECWDETVYWFWYCKAQAARERTGVINTPVFQDLNAHELKQCVGNFDSWLKDLVAFMFFLFNVVLFYLTFGLTSWPQKQVVSIRDKFVSYRAGFKNEDYDDLEVIPEQHYESKNCRRFFHATGNDYLRITHAGRAPVCTCKPYTYKKIIQVDTPIHFGSCELNLEAAMKARAYNTHLSPDPRYSYAFRTFVKEVWFPRVKDLMTQAVYQLSSEDYLWANFIADTDPKKRRVYERGMEDFLMKHQIDTLFELFSKPNELHQDSLRDVRARLLCNPSASMKAVGSYMTRLMIKVMKQVEPGFISGYSLTDLAEKMKEERDLGFFTGHFVASGDFTSLDSHQAIEHIESVDHFVMSFLIPLICSRSECKVPAFLAPVVLSALTIKDYSVFTKTGMKAKIIGTVFSGHPTLTTLFNTTRVILYHRFAFWLLNYRLEGSIRLWVSGDDFLLWSPIEFPIDHWLEVLGGHGGVKGLGQNLRDVKIGPLEQHTFLSKEFLISNEKIEFIPVSQRFYKAGTGYNVKSGLTTSEFRTAQWISNAGMHSSISSFRDRFLDGVVQGMNTKIDQLLKFDWAYRMKLRESLPDPELDIFAFYKTDQKFLLKISIDRADRAGYISEFNYETRNDESIMGTATLDCPYSDPKISDINSQIKMYVNRVVQLKEKRKNKKRRNKAKKLSLVPQKPVVALPTRKLVRTPKLRPSRTLAYNNWLEEHHRAEYQYALGLFAPKEKHCVRMPQPLPIATAVATQRGSFIVTTNATGYLFVACIPWNTSLISYYNAAALADNVVIPLSSSSITSIMSTSNITSYRVVSAWMGGVDLTAALTKTGTITVGNIPYSEISGAVGTSDTLRDTLWSDNFSSQEVLNYKGGFYLPMDPSGSNFYVGTNKPSDFEVPFFYASGLAATTNVSVEYCVNFEYVPAVGQTDLLAVDLGHEGIFDNGLAMASRVRKARATDKAAAQEHGFTHNVIEALHVNSSSGALEYAQAGATGYALGGLAGGAAAVAGRGMRNLYDYYLNPISSDQQLAISN